MDSIFAIKKARMILLSFIFLRLKAKLHNFRDTRISQKSKRPTPTLMKIKVLSFLVLLRALNSY